MQAKQTTYSDEQIIAGCRAGDRKYQELLYQRFASKMFTVCMRYAAESNSAQDLLQEGFVKIFKNIDKFRGEGSFEGWIRRIFVNTCLEFVRKKANMYVVQDTETVKVEYHDENALQKLMKEDLMEMIQSLSTGYRTIFNLYVIEGYSHKEIAELLNVTEGTSKSQLARARYLLQKKVEILMGIKAPIVQTQIAE
ncbi:MAG: sigma-70 family RNA polymerase sigma factor [Chitinophagales bacterium]|jgi:RNA polymerase sigma-70 factor (ECF subfamily)|nr:sigma-70 family RNA polymerase sigma factor [Chitinophagales bacterium]